MQLLFLGDFLYDYKNIQKDIKELGQYFRQNNYNVVLNLEAPLKSNTPIKKWINLYNSERLIDVLKTLNIVAVNLANNHIMDWGRKGLEQLLDILDNNNIIYFGAGLNLKDACNPKILTIKEKKIGLLGFGWDEEMCIYAKNNAPGIAPLKEKLILKSINDLQEQTDKIVVNLHWGYEYELYPLPVHRELAHKIIDEGADLIVGHHEHIIQSYEKHNNKHIFYGLGNFYFGNRRNTFNKNNIGQKFSKYGLGVLYNNTRNSVKHIYFKYENDRTKIVEDYKLENISDISLTEYANNYKKLRTTHSKPILYAGRYQNYTNNLKLKISKFKRMIINLAIKSFIRIRIYNFVKKFIKKLKITRY